MQEPCSYKRNHVALTVQSFDSQPLEIPANQLLKKAWLCANQNTDMDWGLNKIILIQDVVQSWHK